MEISWHITEKDFFLQLPREKEDFISFARLRNVEKNQFLFQEGETGDSCFYLEEGEVRIYRITPCGKEVIVFIRHPGELFGLAEIMGEKKRVFNAQAITHCRLYEIKKKEFEILLQRHYSIAKRVIEVMGRRIRYLGEQMESLMVSDVSTRLLNLLICLGCHNVIDLEALNKPLPVPVKLTQEQMAAMIGSTQQTVSETLKKLQEEGLIRLSGKKIIILNPKDIFERILL